LPLAFTSGFCLWLGFFTLGFGLGLLLWDERLLPLALGFLVWEAFGKEKNY
jgi:hypothetical protein